MSTTEAVIKSSELEFQGNVLTWINAELARRPGLGLEMATQEPSKISRRRNDLVVWRHRASNDAFLTLELKTPETAITDVELIRDACEKGQRWNAPFFGIWNMRSAEIYHTPDANRLATHKDRIQQFPTMPDVTSVKDWIEPRIREILRKRSIEILDTAWDEAARHEIQFPIDASVFVDRLTRRIIELRAEVYPALAKQVGHNKALRSRIRHLAAAQGFLGFIDDVNAAIAGQFCYRIVGQILFYFALRRRQPFLKALDPDKSQPFLSAVRPFWDNVRRLDYEALFEPNEVEQIVPIPQHAEELLYSLIDDFNKYNWNVLRDDILGSIFEQMVPRNEQILLGQFYTRNAVADILLVFAIDGDRPIILDPGCGSGTFLLGAYQYLRDIQGLTHTQILPLLWGFDISPFAAELSVINLFRQDLTEFDNFPRIFSGDFFRRAVGERLEFPPAKRGIQKKITIQIPQFDAIVANPPYLRSQQQDDLDAEYKARLFSLVAREHGYEIPAKTDLFAFFVYHAYHFLRPGGRLAFVTSSSWLTADYGYFLQRFLLEKFKLIAIIASETESFFTQVDQNTVLFVAEKRDENDHWMAEETIRFVTLKRHLEEIFSGDSEHWKKIQEIVEKIESIQNHYSDDTMRIRCISTQSEIAKLREEVQTRNWSLPLRAPEIYFELIETNPNGFVPLEELAECHLGYKSLQNQFYYVDDKTIADYGIEEEFLIPLYQMSDLDEKRFLQTVEPSTHVLVCNRRETDLRGTGMLKYIRSMGGQAAAIKKQSGPTRTISQVLSEQGGAIWYAPKAIPHSAHIWLRKAFDGTYAAFIFKESQVLDQRCNYLAPRGELKWEAIAAILTSSIFALFIEATGSASMGAGALEIPTTKLSKILVPDIRQIPTRKRNQLIKLAETVWTSDPPINWKDVRNQPSPNLRKLDEFLLKECAIKTSTDKIYDGIRQTLASRIKLAHEKAKSKKNTETADITAVAKSIIDNIRPLLESKRFPESFVPPGSEMTSIEIDPNETLEILVEPFMGETEIHITDANGNTIIDETLERSTAEILLRSLFLGRRRFSVPTNAEVAQIVITEYWKWLPPITEKIAAECASSSLGTRFEGEIQKTVMKMIAWADGIDQIEIHGQFSLPEIKREIGATDR